MIRRLLVNFALLSMMVDGLCVAVSLWGAATIRPSLNAFPVFELIPSPLLLPAGLFILFPLTYVLIYSALAIYDGRKYLRAVDEFTALTLGTSIAAVSAAGILYFSYRDLSRALFVLFVSLACLRSPYFWLSVTRFASPFIDHIWYSGRINVKKAC